MRISGVAGGTSVETSGLVNTGFESPEPEVALPLTLVEKLRLYPPPEGAVIYEYTAFGGVKVKVTLVPKSLWIQVVGKGSKRKVRATAAISEAEDEVLISDNLASALGIVPEDPRRGMWRFRWEGLKKLRTSARPEHWR